MKTLQNFAVTVAGTSLNHNDPQFITRINNHMKQLLDYFDNKFKVEFQLERTIPRGYTASQKAVAIMNTLLQWLPGNIFYGPPPELRIDDPKDSFEKHSIYIMNGDTEAYEYYKFLNDLMEKYFADTQYRNKENYQLIIYGIEELANAKPFEFKMDQWKIVGPKLEIKKPNCDLGNRSKRALSAKDTKICQSINKSGLQSPKGNVKIQSSPVNDNGACFLSSFYEYLENNNKLNLFGF